MSSDLAMRVEGLGKAYTIRHQHSDHVTLAQVALERAMHPLRRNQRELIWALEDVSFELKRGEVLGVIGRNGAGKSTLLKLLTRITQPTTGRIDLWGRVGSLLEVGTGFHPELTGRENVYLNGSILGMTRAEITRQFDAIVDFAGVEQFLDTPVKRYSSGMYVRLAFAVAAHLETEILLVDEVLAVGDQEFQRKCLGKMHDVAAAGRTVLFVSHQLESVTRLCTSALQLDAGRVGFLGDVQGAVDGYLSSGSSEGGHASATTERDRPGAEVLIRSVTTPSAAVRPGAPQSVHIEIKNQTPSRQRVYLAAVLRSARGDSIVHCDSRLTGFWVDLDDTADVEFRLLHPWLRPGSYVVDAYVCGPGVVLDAVEAALSFDVLDTLPYVHSATADAVQMGAVLGDFEYRLIGPAVSPLDPGERQPSPAARRPS
jgi:lipopolysaccharide transport system ATP-binding protein